VWSELRLRVRPEAAEAVAELLGEVSGAGVAIEPAIAALGPDEGYTLDEAAHVMLKGYFYGPVGHTRRSGVRRRLRGGSPPGAIAGRLAWREIREEDWAESWKQYYEIQHVGRIVVRPAWLEYEPRPDEIVVALDPGMAFGTGQHPTTQMCLMAMQAIELRGARILDLGAGSGVLALAAIGLGATYCLALDIEQQAVTAAVANTKLNGAEDRIDVRRGSIEGAIDAAPFDVVFANINAAAITSLADEMAAVMKPGGALLAGGIIEERLAAPAEALPRAGFETEQVIADGDWRTIVARKTAH
jgi:ribosomal protein L11 methyltransferase